MIKKEGGIMDFTRFETELTLLRGTLSKLLSDVLKMLEDSISSLKKIKI